MNLISSKIAKHVDVLKFSCLQTCAWDGTVGLQQLLHYDVTTHYCETLTQTLAM